MLFLLLKLNFKIFIIVMNFKYLLYTTQTTHSLVDPNIFSRRTVLGRRMSLEERKTKEGEDHLAAAAKYLETSAWKLKFSPDWDSASDEFNKAAVCFKVGRTV